jgi:catechol 2,3-dioxygenase-like lactoylglutathione lyase family enzyme
MIQRQSHTSIYVLDQDRAKAFYTEKLGFDVREDVQLGTFRWLTVGPKGQPDHQIVLMPITPSPFMNEAACATLRELVATVGVSSGVFQTADCKATYAELKAKGVEFKYEPSERPYGIEALFKDDSGNWFSLVQRPQ